jgi:hypothetical protein
MYVIPIWWLLYLFSQVCQFLTPLFYILHLFYLFNSLFIRFCLEFIGFIWLWTRCSGGLLCTRYWALGFHKRRGISVLSGRLLAFEYSIVSFITALFFSPGLLSCFRFLFFLTYFPCLLTSFIHSSFSLPFIFFFTFPSFLALLFLSS